MAHPPVGLYRLHYDPRTCNGAYAPKNHDGCTGTHSPGALTCPALDFLAALCTHVPDAGQQLIRYYGEWSHVRRARARKTGSPPAQPLPSSNTRDGCGGPSKRTWARLIKKVYEADPLLCRRCCSPLKIVGLIDVPSVIERILRHLKLRDRPERPPPASAPGTLHYDVDVQIPVWEDDLGSFEETE